MRSSMASVEIGSRAEQGSSIRITCGLHRDGAGDAQALLLAAGEAGAGLVQPVLDLVPQVGARAATSPRGRRPRPWRSSGCSASRRPARCPGWTWWGTGWGAGRPCRSASARSPGPRRGRRGCRRPAGPRPRPGRRECTSCMRFRVRRKVDLPQPEGPMNAVTDLASMLMLTSSTARNLL